MKELFKKYPMLHYTVVLTTIAIVMGLFIGSINAWTEPIIEQNAIDAKNAVYRELLPELDSSVDVLTSDDPSTIVDKVEAYDANNEFIAYIFNAEKTNSYGELSMAVSIAADGEILGAEYLVLSQTLYLDRTAANLALYIGTNIADLTPDGDLQGGATYSKTTMIELLTDISTSFAATAGDIVVDPYVEFFGEGYTISDDNNFDSTAEVLSKKDVTNSDSEVVGYVYEVEGLGIYESGNNEEKSIKLVVTLDTSNKILSIELPSGDYQHSGGSLKTSAVSYAETLVGTNLADYTIDADLTSGATNSKTLIRELLVALKGVVIPS